VDRRRKACKKGLAAFAARPQFHATEKKTESVMLRRSLGELGEKGRTEKASEVFLGSGQEPGFTVYIRNSKVKYFCCMYSTVKGITTEPNRGALLKARPLTAATLFLFYTKTQKKKVAKF